MKVLELTNYNGDGKKEYVAVEEISNWFAHTIDEVETFEEEVRTGLFGLKTEKVTSTRTVGSRDGSVVYLKNGKKTYVYESPTEIASKLKSNEVINLGE